MEDLELISSWAGKRVLVTGHTGFKGGWLAFWLRSLGATVVGVGLAESPSLSELLEFDLAASHYLDIRDAPVLGRCIRDFQPEVVFHLAAQPLVRRSYTDPVLTWQTNVMGTIHLLEALRTLKHPVAAVCVTTDKVYQNQEWQYGYREADPLGGRDPYSSSKAAMEIAVNSWRESFFEDGAKVAVATARAGNVLGGGDWAQDRIIPDIIRSLEHDQPIAVRNPAATRPWQHVLEPLAGYLELAARMHRAQRDGDCADLATLCSAWNFGPFPESNRSVKEVVESVLRHWPGRWMDHSEANAPHEAKFLALAIEKSARYLSWQPRWDFETTIEMCVDWYRRVGRGEAACAVTLEQIEQYACCLKS